MAYDAETTKLLAAVAAGVRAKNVGAVLRLTRRLVDERDAARAELRQRDAGFPSNNQFPARKTYP